MHGAIDGRDDSEAGEGYPTAPPPEFTLDGRDIIASACMAAFMQGQRSMNEGSDFDFADAIFDGIREVSSVAIGPYGPSDWLCINLADYRVGRAYDYKGEYRIVPMRPDVDMLSNIEASVTRSESGEDEG